MVSGRARGSIARGLWEPSHEAQAEQPAQDANRAPRPARYGMRSGTRARAPTIRSRCAIWIDTMDFALHWRVLREIWLEASYGDYPIWGALSGLSRG
jgi:hypothetical protein